MSGNNNLKKRQPHAKHARARIEYEDRLRQSQADYMSDLGRRMKEADDERRGM